MRTLCKPSPKVRALSRYCPGSEQRCAPFSIFGRAMPKSANPSQTTPKVRTLDKSGQDLQKSPNPFFVCRRVATSANPVTVLASMCSKVRTLRKYFRKVRTPSVICLNVQGYAKTSNPSARLCTESGLPHDQPKKRFFMTTL